MKFKLKNFNSVVYDEEYIQEVDYIYSIDDSVGLLKITLTISEDADPVEYFILRLKDIYRDLGTYIVYHGKYKYMLETSTKDNMFVETYLTKTKMW